MARRHSAVRKFGLVMLAVLLVRLVIDVIGLALRLMCWVLLRMCWGCEWAVDRLSARDTLRPSGVITAERPRPTRQPVQPTSRAKSAPAEPTDVDKVCKLLGSRANDPEARAMAERIVGKGVR